MRMVVALPATGRHRRCAALILRPASNVFAPRRRITRGARSLNKWRSFLGWRGKNSSVCLRSEVKRSVSPRPGDAVSCEEQNNCSRFRPSTRSLLKEHRIDRSFSLRDDGLPPSRRLPALRQIIILRQITVWLLRLFANLRLMVQYLFCSFLLSHVNGRAICL
jgi:hypothetical protein